MQKIVSKWKKLFKKKQNIKYYAQTSNSQNHANYPNETAAIIKSVGNELKWRSIKLEKSVEMAN